MGNGYKWWRIKLLKQDNLLAQHLPSTQTLTEDHLWNMLTHYRKVIIKPSFGSGGFGVIQLTRLGGDHFRLQKDRIIIQLGGKRQTYQYIKKITSYRPHIIQQRIPLAEINGRPFDVRVMVQRKRGATDWSVTGRLAKIAGPGYIVTNILHSKGRVLPLRTAIANSNITGAAADAIINELDEIALTSARRLYARYPKTRVLGIDAGIDKTGKVWIIETNFAPMISLFRHLKDKTMYNTILGYKQ